MMPGLASEQLDRLPDDPAVVAAHLENLIETQPACVMRVDVDGCLLAANTAALQLLAADNHAQVLGSPLGERIASEAHADWTAFLKRTWSDGSGSLECELVDLKGHRRTAMLQGVAQRTTLDRVQSVIVTAQDISLRRRLESMVEQHRTGPSADDLQHRLQQTEAERQRLEHILDERQVDERQTAAKLEETNKALAAYRVELAQLMDNNVRHLEPMAAAGRIAGAVARDVQTIVTEVDARTRELLTHSDPDSADRRAIEMLRGSFLRISSLVRQLIQATGGTAP